MLGLIRFLRQEAPAVIRPMLVTLCLAGAANCALVVFINAGAESVRSETAPTARLMLLFAISLAIFVVASIAAGCRGRSTMESSMTALRIRLFDKMRKAKLLAIESIKPSEVLAKISKDVGQILQSTDSLVFSFQAMIMLVACCLYMAAIEPVALIAVAAGCGTLGYIRYVRSKTTRQNLRELIVREGAHSNLVADVLGGFKEMKISEARSRSMFGAFKEVAESARDMGTETGHHYIKSTAYMQGGAFIIMGIIVFLMPQYMTMHADEILILSTLIIFMIGAMMGVVTNIPEFAQADAALTNLYELEKLLDDAVEQVPADPEAMTGTLGDFDRIAVAGLAFSYKDKSGRPSFSVGPLDLSIEKGKVHFIIGGNGSGKSTMLKLLTGLYLPDTGEIRVNDTPVGAENVHRYRNMFSAVFSEGYLFDRFYGLEDVDEGRVADLIEIMKLQDKVRYQNGRFSDMDLSTGQRKRLALIRALLEDRDIYVFDEWAAEQDQHFRKFFYENILATLKERGKTVIAVTHDEKYWDIADKVFEFDFGRIVS